MLKQEKESVVLLNSADLNKLRNDSEACVKVKKCVHHIILHPFHLANVSNAIKEILNEGITKYHQEFEGILLGYENIKLFGYKAPMYDDKCYLHKKIEAEFYIFNPKIGSTLTGVVNSKTEDHIGCLVHKLFNISLPRPSDGYWLGDNALVGQSVQFRVTFMNLRARLPYVRGELLTLMSEDSGISTSDEVPALPKSKISRFTPSYDASENESVKRKKLLKRKKVEESDDDDEDNAAPEDWSQFESVREKLKMKKMEELGGENIGPHKKKVKKEKKQVKEDKTTLIEGLEREYQEELTTLKEMSCLDTGVKLKKKKKAHKEHSENGTDGVILNSSDIKKQKKHKKEKRKIKKEQKERDLLDETLPDLNLDALFQDDTIDLNSSVKSEPIQSDDIVLPNDPEMDELLKDIPKHVKKSNKAKKRKMDSADVDTDCVNKKKKCQNI